MIYKASLISDNNNAEFSITESINYLNNFKLEPCDFIGIFSEVGSVNVLTEKVNTNTFAQKMKELGNKLVAAVDKLIAKLKELGNKIKNQIIKGTLKSMVSKGENILANKPKDENEKLKNSFIVYDAKNIKNILSKAKEGENISEKLDEVVDNVNNNNSNNSQYTKEVKTYKDLYDVIKSYDKDLVDLMTETVNYCYKQVDQLQKMKQNIKAKCK